MATPKLLLTTIKRSHLVLRAISSSSSHEFLAEKPHLTDTRLCNQPLSYSKWPFSTTNSLSFYNNFLSCRSYSTSQSSDLDDEFGEDLKGAIDHRSHDDCASQIAETLANVGGGTEESIFPVRAVISMLDGYHHLTGLPWWIVIASSTLALRLVLLPVLICQLHNLARIAELFPKLPPPLPPPMAGKSYIDHFKFFRKERKSIGCPSYFWFMAYVSMQFPCFLLWMTSIRRMSLDHHPDFDSGGILWFQNLTELPHGLLSPILPLLIGGLYFVNVQVSFRNKSIGDVKGLFGLLAKYYKIYLNFMTVPLILTAFCIPQGSLIYWITNSSITLLQSLTLGHPIIRHKLGLPDAVKNKKLPQEISEPVLLFEPSKAQRRISGHNLSPQELLAVSVLYLSKGEEDRAIPLLRMALDKDPKYVRAIIVLGQTHLQNGFLVEAIEHFERAISMLIHVGQPTETEEVDHLILASQLAGVAYARQGKFAEGLVHFERISRLKEPEDPKSKARYNDSLVFFASTLSNLDRKDEAEKYLRMAAAYNPDYKSLLEECENSNDGFVSNLAETRRRDY